MPAVRDVVAYVVSDDPARRVAAGYLGPAPLAAMAATIATSRGPSGRNVDYLRRLDGWLLAHGVDDPHVRRLAKAVAALDAGDDEARVCDDEAAGVRVAGAVVVDNGAAEVVSSVQETPGFSVFFLQLWRPVSRSNWVRFGSFLDR